MSGEGEVCKPYILGRVGAHLHKGLVSTKNSQELGHTDTHFN